MRNKIFFSNSLISIIFKIIFALILILFFIFIFLNLYLWKMLLVIAIIYSLCFLFLLSSLFGIIKINNNFIKVYNDNVFKNNRMQFKDKITISDIFSIEFIEEDCTSIESKISWRFVGSPSYLKILMKDNSIKS